MRRRLLSDCLGPLLPPPSLKHCSSNAAETEELDSHLKALLTFAPFVLSKQHRIYSQLRLISLRLIEHSRIFTDFLGTGRPHSKQ